MEGRLLLAVFTVDRAVDDASVGSLRWAIEQANAGAGGDRIEFALPTSGGLATISVASALPAIAKPVTIDGTTQSSFIGTPVVVLDGAGLGGGNGLRLTGGGTTVKGLVIQNFPGAGLLLAGDDNVIQGCYVGLTAEGTIAAGNGDGGIRIQSSHNLIGGTETGQGNVISGNFGDGVALASSATIRDNLIQGNLIGTDSTGTKVLGNSASGVSINGSVAATTIGGTLPAARNVISGNGLYGIETFGISSGGTVVQGNLIGTDVGRAFDLGNGGDGVHLFTSDNTIGGLATGAGNTIAFNGAGGVGSGVAVVLGSNHDAILSNTIVSNAGRGINLGGSGNNNQQAPTLTAASADASSTTISGTLTGTPNATYTLQFFANDLADPSTFGEGQIFLGTATLAFGASSTAVFSQTVPFAAQPGQFLSATATDPSGNTSEFSNDVTIRGTADLAVTMEGLPGSARVDDVVTYRVTVTNLGPTMARDVTLTDVLPANAAFVSADADPDALQSGGAGTRIFHFGNLAAGEAVHVTIVVRATAGSTPSITNQASVASDDDSAAGNNSATITTPVAATADVRVSVSADRDSVPPGQDITYTVTVTNAGPSTADGVVLTNALPDGVSLVSITPLARTVPSGNTMTTSVGSLAVGQSLTLTIVATPSASNVPSITESASVTSDAFDSDTSNNAATAIVAVTPVADVQVDLDVTSSVDVGQDLTLTLTVRNSGPSPATDVLASLPIPVDLTFVSATDSRGGTPDFSDGVVSEAIPSLDSGAVVTLTIILRPADSASGTYTLTADVRAAQDDPDTDNNQDTVSTSVEPVSDLSVTMTASPGTVTAGQTVGYTITVTNLGPSSATQVKLVDTLPPGVTVVSAALSTGTIAASPGSLAGDVGDLAAGASATMTVTIATSASNTPSITNLATATADQKDPAPDDNSTSATTAVGASADLSVKFDAPPTPSLQGQPLTYSLVVTNRGPSPATSVSVSVPLPAGTSFVSASDTRGVHFTPTSGAIVGDLGGLAPGASVTLTVVVTPTAAGPLVESATVSGADPDPATDDNTATRTVQVLPVSDLDVAVAVDRARVTMGERVTFVVTAMNRGPSPASGVFLTNILPTGVDLVGLATSQGTVARDQNTIKAALGALAVGGQATLTLVVVPWSAGAFLDAAKVVCDQASSPLHAQATAIASVVALEPAGTLQFATSSVVVAENARQATIVVTRTGGSQGTVAVRYGTVGGGSATAGVDYRPVGGWLVFHQGETTKTITVPVLGNPFDKRNETVRIALNGTLGGATLGPRTLMTLTIRDIDPDFVPPRVDDVRLFGPASGISTIQVIFSEPVDPASAANLIHYRLVDAGADGRVGTSDDRRVALRGAGYNVASRTMTLRPASTLRSSEFYFLSVAGVTDRSGNVLAGGPGARAGTAFGTYFARGTSLSYLDSRGTRVSFAITGGGVLDLSRSVNGEGQRLQVLNPVPRRSVLSGRVQGGSGTTTLQSIIGLGAFNVVRVDVRTPPFFIRQLPFDRRMVSPPAVDRITP